MEIENEYHLVKFSKQHKDATNALKRWKGLIISMDFAHKEYDKGDWKKWQ